jgi:hypothetical protein
MMVGPERSTNRVRLKSGKIAVSKPAYKMLAINQTFDLGKPLDVNWHPYLAIYGKQFFCATIG